MNRRVHHVALVVREMEDAFAFYRDQLGLPLRKVKRLEDQGVIAALLGLANAEIELLQPIDRQGGVARYLERRGEGLHHICLTTPDLPAEIEALRGRGIDLVDQAPRQGLAGQICFLHPRAHAGVLVELVEEAEGRPAAAPAEPADAPAPALRLAGVSAVASDLDVAVGAWRNASGLSASRVVYDERAGAMSARLEVRDIQIDIMLPTHESSSLARELAVRGEGLVGLRFDAADLDQMVALLEVRGVSVGEPSGDLSAPRLAFVGPDETFGVPLEIGESPR
jgi:methylmalonyl-CoA epimerase